MSKKVANPISTGGGGTDYERRVGAYYLAMTLLGAVPRGQDAGVAQEVRFQRLFEGDPLDDLVVYLDTPAGQARLALQVKRDLSFGEENKYFNEVMRASWETFKSPRFNPETDRFGICIALYSKTIDEYYLNVLRWAQDSVSAEDFLTRISEKHLSHETQRSFVKLIKSQLDKHNGEKISEDELWRFLSRMVILNFDFHKDGSRDYAYTVELLKNALPSEKHRDSPQLFLKLVDYAAQGNTTAGSFDSAALVQRLQSDGFRLLPSSDCRADLVRLNEHARLALSDIGTDIAGLKLNRTSVIAEAKESLGEATLLEITGAPGAGKSAVLKALVEIQRRKGPVLFLAADRLEGKGWDSFARKTGFDQPLRNILLALSGNDQPSVFIDGVDRIVDADARRVINDFLRTLGDVPLSYDNSRRWTIVVTAREENLQELHSWLHGSNAQDLKIVRVPELSSEEMTLISTYQPRLSPLFATRQLDPVIKNPFMLSLLTDSRMIAEFNSANSVASEIEVSIVWWQRLVGANGSAGLARQQTLLEFGKRAVSAPGRRLPNEGSPVEALVSLEQDRILLRDAGRDAYRFGHDILEDWVLYRVLDQQRDDLPLYIQRMGQPHGLIRAVQLLGCFLLERESDAREWARLLEQVEQSIGLAARWRLALLTAPLVSTRSRELLDRAESLLVADDARRLVDLLVALRTVEVNPDYSLLPYLKEGKSDQHDFMAVMMSRPIPRWRTWSYFLGWLLERVDRLPASVQFEAAKIMEIWQQKSPPEAIHRSRISGMALNWLTQIEEL